MINFNDVDIYTCKFFTLNEDKELSFWGGKYKGKSARDFTNLRELLGAINYCFWIIRKEDVPMVSKYTASAFLKELTPKISELEKRLRYFAINEQKELAQKAEELTKTSGRRHI